MRGWKFNSLKCFLKIKKEFNALKIDKWKKFLIFFNLALEARKNFNIYNQNL